MIRCQNNINKAGAKDELRLAEKMLNLTKMHFWLCSGQEQEELDPWLEPDGTMLACDKEEGKQHLLLISFVIFNEKNDLQTAKEVS